MEILSPILQWAIIFIIVSFVLSGQVKKHSLPVTMKQVILISLVAIILATIAYVLIYSGIKILILENKSLLQGISKAMVSVLIFISYMLFVGGSILVFYFSIQFGLKKILTNEDSEKIKLVANHTTGNSIGLIIFIGVILWCLYIMSTL